MSGLQDPQAYKMSQAQAFMASKASEQSLLNIFDLKLIKSVATLISPIIFWYNSPAGQ